MSYVKQKRAAKKQDEPQSFPENSGLRPPLATEMHVEFVVNDEGGVWLLHDKPFPAILQWVEFDQESNIVTLITQDGRIQDLGMVIPEPVGELLIDTDEICAMLMQDGRIQDIGIVPVIARETVFH